MTNKEKFEQVFSEDIVKLWYKPAALFMSWLAEDYDDIEPVHELRECQGINVEIDYDKISEAVYEGVKKGLLETQIVVKEVQNE